MRRYTVYSQLLWLLALLGWHSASAQIQFTNPQFPNSPTNFSAGGATPTSGNVAISPSNSIPFTVTVYRTTGNANEGYVSIWSGVNGPTKQLTSTATGSYSTTFGGWNSNGGVDSKTLSGSFTTSLIDAGHQKLYAVFTNSGTGTVVNSAPITIVPGTPSSGGGAVSRITYLCVPYNTAPQKLQATYNGNPLNYNNYRLLWQVSTNGGRDYRTTFTSYDSYEFQPPALTAETRYFATLEKNSGFPEYEWQPADANVYFNTTPFFYVSVQAFTPIVSTNNVATCGGDVGFTVQNMPNAPLSEYTINWSVPTGWKINGQGTSLTEIRGRITVTPPPGLPQGSTHQIRYSANGTCGPRSADQIATVTIDYTTYTPNPGSFYIMRYDGCRKFYGISAQGVTADERHTYFASVTSNGVAGPSAAGIYNQSTGRVTFPLEMEVPYGGSQVTGTITIAGPCGSITSSAFSEYLSGVDPGCVDPGGPGGTQDMTTASYPNPANESLTVPKDIEEATLFDGRGRAVQKLNKAGKVDVQNLPEGLYNLRMVRKGKLINQRIQVKH